MLAKKSFTKKPLFLGTFLGFSLFSIVLFSSSPAMALSLCSMICSEFYAKYAPGIATIAVIILGIAAAFGSVRPGTAVMAVVGISIIFTAGDIADSAGGGCGNCSAGGGGGGGTTTTTTTSTSHTDYLSGLIIQA